jgi:ribosomal protein RSM22 (predicted rRNA methylase)
MIKIESKLIKRIELDHIQNQIDSLSIIPDFGFSVMLERSTQNGWDILRDFLMSEGKFERLENYIEMRLL